MDIIVVVALDTEVLVSIVVVACGQKKVLQTILLIFFYGGGCGVGIVGLLWRPILVFISDLT